MPPKPKPESEKAQFDPPISFRWNTKLHPHHALALQILEERRAQGHKDRETFAHAIIHGQGLKIKTASTQDLLARLQRIEGKIDQQAEQNAMIVDALQNMDLSAFVNPGTGRTFEQELGERVSQSTYSQIQQNVSSADFDID